MGAHDLAPLIPGALMLGAAIYVAFFRKDPWIERLNQIERDLEEKERPTTQGEKTNG